MRRGARAVVKVERGEPMAAGVPAEGGNRAKAQGAGRFKPARMWLHYRVSWEQWRERLQDKEMEKANHNPGKQKPAWGWGGGQLIEQSSCHVQALPGRKASTHLFFQEVKETHTHTHTHTHTPQRQKKSEILIEHTERAPRSIKASDENLLRMHLGGLPGGARDGGEDDGAAAASHRMARVR